MFNGVVTGQCSEITQYSGENDIASCNLGTLCLPVCIKSDIEGNKYFDFDHLAKLAEEMVENIDNIIDLTYYIDKLPQIERCNKSNRPMGIGVQGLADIFCILDLYWESNEAMILNRNIFETIYYAALTSSINLSEKKGPYPNFYTSPTSRGWFQFDLWDREAIMKKTGRPFNSICLDEVEAYQRKHDLVSDRYDWKELRIRMMNSGIRNSLLISLPPTATTSNIMGNRECIEPFPRNIWKAKLIGGERVMMNKHLQTKLMKYGAWDANVINQLLSNSGDLGPIDLSHYMNANVEEHLKKLFKTAPQIKKKTLCDMNLERSRFVCQSVSYNWFEDDPKLEDLTKIMMYLWKNGAKTILYYLRSKPIVNAMDIKMSSDFNQDNKIDNERIKTVENLSNLACPIDGSCESCSS